MTTTEQFYLLLSDPASFSGNFHNAYVLLQICYHEPLHVIIPIKTMVLLLVLVGVERSTILHAITSGFTNYHTSLVQKKELQWLSILLLCRGIIASEACKICFKKKFYREANSIVRIDWTINIFHSRISHSGIDFFF